MGNDSYSEILLRRLSIIFTAITVGISFIAVTGWIFDWLIIARISNSYIPMSPVSALSFLILSGILFFHVLYPGNIPRFVNRTVVIFVFFFSSIILVEHFSGAKLDIERFLSREPGMFGSAPMGRMSPYTAATMLLACISLFLLFTYHLKRPYIRNAAAGTGIIVTTIGMVFVLDYFYGTLILYGSRIIPVAFNTAVAFVFLGLSLITSAGPYSWPLRLMIGLSVRARLMRSFLPFPIAILLVYGLIHSYFFTGTIDSAMASSFTAILSLVILSIAITRISDIIGGEIEQAINERKQSEKKLFESEQKYRRIVDTANEGIWVMDENFVATYVNKQMADMLGYKQEEIMGAPINAFMFEEDLSDHQQKIQTRQQGISAQYERRFRRKDGSELWTIVSAKPIMTGEDRFLGSFAMFTDITQRKFAEGKLVRANRLYAVLSQVNQAIVRTQNRDELFREICNIAVEYGKFKMAWVGVLDDDKKSVTPVAYSGFEDGYIEYFKALAADKRESPGFVENVFHRGNFAVCNDIRNDPEIPAWGEEAIKRGYLSSASFPITSNNKVIGAFSIYASEPHFYDEDEIGLIKEIASDVSYAIEKIEQEELHKRAGQEKRKLEEQLLQAQKMEAVGQLAGGVAHDFNNILTAMIGYGYMLKMKMKKDDPLRSHADHILSLSDKAAGLTQSLLAFSRKQVMNPRPVNLNEIIKRIDHLLSRIIGEDIQLQNELYAQDLIVMADPGQIEQALMNLATNARDAMPEGGLLTIKTETVSIDNEFIKEHGFGKEGRYALILFADMGAGMDRETMEKIFEPFFTMKEVGKGTGLGLAMVYGIIKQHDGYINVYSEPGKGTTFRIYLPLIHAKAAMVESEVIQTIESGSETVLLAEDETEVRAFMKDFLEEYGYKVIEAIDGEDAINKFMMYKDNIQLALLDVIMPNKNGREVYDEIKKRTPDIKVLFMSGYPADIIHKQGIIEKGFAYIEKPASPTRLLKKIREVLGNSSFDLKSEPSELGTGQARP